MLLLVSAILDACVCAYIHLAYIHPNSGKFFAPARLSFHETVATVESCVCVYAAACFGDSGCVWYLLQY